MANLLENVLHRIDDLESCILTAGAFLFVLHRIDDLEIDRLTGLYSVRVLHRIDDLEKSSIR